MAGWVLGYETNLPEVLEAEAIQPRARAEPEVNQIIQSADSNNSLRQVEAHCEKIAFYHRTV